MKKIFLLLVLAVQTLHAQDPHFSQYFSSGMYLNPAKTGELSGWAANLNYRNQWQEIDGGYVTYLGGIQKSVSKYISGIGLNFLNDQASNTLTTTAIGLNLAKKFQLSEKLQFRFGLNLEYRKKSIDQSNLVYGNQIDPQLGFVNSNEPPFTGTTACVNPSIGFDATFLNLNVGIAISNIIEPNESLIGGSASNLPRRYSYYANYKIKLNDNLSIIPQTIFQTQADFTTFLSNVVVKYKIVSLMTGFRHNDAFISGIGISLDRFKFQYTYDLTTSKLINETGGSHEIALIFRFGSKNGYDDNNFAF